MAGFACPPRPRLENVNEGLFEMTEDGLFWESAKQAGGGRYERTVFSIHVDDRVGMTACELEFFLI